MSNFTEYGDPPQEWLDIQETLPKSVPDQSLEDLILATNRGREAASKEGMKALASQVTTQNYSIPTRDGAHVLARSYRPSRSISPDRLPLYIYFHGGGFLFGTIDSEDAGCARVIAAGVNCVVLNVNYRHTPKHVYPTAWNDSEDAFVWVHQHLDELGVDGDRVIVGGSSAGAHLTAGMVLRQHVGDIFQGLPKPLGQVLLIPWLVEEASYDAILGKLSDPSVSSYKTNAFAPVLPLTRIRMFNDLLKLPEKIEASDLRLNPGLAKDEQVKGLPPTVFGIAGLDPLRDEGLLFAKQLAENGVPTDVTIFQGVPHGFRRFGDRLSASQHWDSAIADGIRWILSQPKNAKMFEIKVR